MNCLHLSGQPLEIQPTSLWHGFRGRSSEDSRVKDQRGERH